WASAAGERPSEVGLEGARGVELLGDAAGEGVVAVDGAAAVGEAHFAEAVADVPAVGGDGLGAVFALLDLLRAALLAVVLVAGAVLLDEDVAGLEVPGDATRADLG